MAVPFTTFTTRQWAVLTSKIDKLFIGIGITFTSDINCLEFMWDIARQVIHHIESIAFQYHYVEVFSAYRNKLG
jgi:protoheme ferro-lyase